MWETHHNNADLDCFKTLIHVCAHKLDVQETDFSSLDAGLRMDGIPALTLWDLVIEVFHSVANRIDGPKREPW